MVGITTATSFLFAPAPPTPAFQGTLASPAPDPTKPTVAVVLALDGTEITDALAPYVVFQATGAFNVITVAETLRPVPLTGNLDVLPQFTFAALDARFGWAPDVIVVPNVLHLGTNEALRLWIKRHGQGGKSLVMSVCAGAEMVAAAGLLDGRPATTHWGDIARIKRKFPAVRWVRGQRYVDDGSVISTGGILSGVDGALRVIARLQGRDLAERVAQALHLETRYLDQTAISQFHLTFPDALITALNLLYRWDRPTLGAALFDGIDDLALASLYDTVPTALAGRLVSVAPEGPVTTRSGLHLVARRTPQQWATSRPLLIAGTPPAPPAWTAAYRRRPEWSSGGPFPFSAVLLGLARHTDLPTAVLASKRLEFRSWDAPPRGRRWWTSTVVLRPLALGALSLVLFRLLEQRPWNRRRLAAGL